MVSACCIVVYCNTALAFRQHVLFDFRWKIAENFASAVSQRAPNATQQKNPRPISETRVVVHSIKRLSLKA